MEGGMLGPLGKGEGVMKWGLGMRYIFKIRNEEKTTCLNSKVRLL